ncbi:MAG: DUF488 domain-containing protein [Saprospiraceae bacterium]|nr:DUF488 domain-containing protein [Saprospiraceae bacterium]
MIQIKRIYAKNEATDGYRVLVDRVWPRGVSKESAHIDEWLKELGPSTELRKWFGHIPQKFPEFEQKYRYELASVTKTLQRLKSISKKQTLTLPYSAKDEIHNQAMVLSKVLEELD